MTKEEADAQVAAAERALIAAIKKEPRAITGYPFAAFQVLLSTEAARKALDRPRLRSLDEFVQRWRTSSNMQAMVRDRELEILAGAGMLPSSSIAEDACMHWRESDRLISLTDLRRLVMGET